MHYRTYHHAKSQKGYESGVYTRNGSLQLSFADTQRFRTTKRLDSVQRGCEYFTTITLIKG
jgi:hypothetical protein